MKKAAPEFTYTEDQFSAIKRKAPALWTSCASAEHWAGLRDTLEQLARDYYASLLPPEKARRLYLTSLIALWAHISAEWASGRLDYQGATVFIAACAVPVVGEVESITNVALGKRLQRLVADRAVIGPDFIMPDGRIDSVRLPLKPAPRGRPRRRKMDTLG